MKICLINNLYQPFNRGGAEQVTLNIARGLLAAGHEVFIITTKPRFLKSKGRLLVKPGAGKVKVYHLNSLYYNLGHWPKFIRFFWHLWDMLNVINYFQIKTILEREKCDRVISNNLMGLGYLTSLAIKKLKIRHLHLVHDIQLIHPSGLLYYGQESLISGYFSRNYSGLTSYLFDSPAVVIFPSRWLRDLHLAKIFFIKSKRIVLPNPVAPLHPAISGPGVKIFGRENQPEIFKFLYLGQIEKHKGVNLLIQAFKKVRQEFSQTELIIAGQGLGLPSAKEAAGGDPNIKFLGQQDQPGLNQLLISCHSLVLPTLCYENCPAVILEAWSAGLPVIAADLGGVSELLNKNAGLLFKPASLNDLVSKMVHIFTNRDNLSSMIKAGKEKAALSNLENYIQELEKLLK